VAPSVLVADDEPRLLRRLERLLESAGYDVMTARDGDEAARVYRAHRGAIGVAVVQWSGAATQSIVVPWTLVTDAASAATLAARIEAAPRMTQEGATSISAMVAYGIGLIEINRLAGTRRVIDISADGRNNTGHRIRAVAPLAAISGVTVNGLAILNEVPTLRFYFEKYVIAGADAFAMEANDYGHYAAAILRKLIREIGNPAVS
jgi:CheY-like chemotaxis protein